MCRLLCSLVTDTDTVALCCIISCRENRKSPESHVRSDVSAVVDIFIFPRAHCRVVVGWFQPCSSVLPLLCRCYRRPLERAGAPVVSFSVTLFDTFHSRLRQIMRDRYTSTINMKIPDCLFVSWHPGCTSVPFFNQHSATSLL